MIKNDPGTKRDLEAHSKGVTAGLDGKKAEDSPYPEWSLNHKYWLKGSNHRGTNKGETVQGLRAMIRDRDLRCIRVIRDGNKVFYQCKKRRAQGSFYCSKHTADRIRAKQASKFK